MCDALARYDEAALQLDRAVALALALHHLAEEWGILSVPGDEACAMRALIDVLNLEIRQARAAQVRIYEVLARAA